MTHPQTAPYRRIGEMIPWCAIAAGLLGFVAVAAHRLYAAASTLGDDLIGLALTTFGLGGLAILVWRARLVLAYRPVSAPPENDLPSLTVVVPAFNEGRQLYDTVASIAASDYPKARLHVVVVDDGSDDDTGLWALRSARDFGAIAVRCPVNRGKRHALYEGFARARGDVIVTVDSDSEVTRDTLRNLVAPLVADPEVGAVAGVVRVLNRKGAIARMLDVSFTYAFDFIRASESVLGAVVCCPGALSAYRRSEIELVKDRWLKQRIFGRPANIGEDRALTNLMLRRGLRVVFQSNAAVLTKVPTHYRGLWRMLLRWARSNIRETMVLGGFVFRRFRRQGRTPIRVLFVHHAIGLALAGLAFPATIAAIVLHPVVLVWLAFASLLTASVPAAVYAFRRQSRGSGWAFGWGLLSTFALSWVTPFALLTPHRTGWLTRTPAQQGVTGGVPRSLPRETTVEAGSNPATGLAG
ncbi:MAG: glycosyltransferase family 2 protein [Myxococcota bacterium]